MIDFTPAITTIVSLSPKLVTNASEKNVLILSILNKLGIEPPIVNKDFENAYKFALVVYGANKPKELLQLFNHDSVKLAFKDYYDLQITSAVEALEGEIEIIVREKFSVDFVRYEIDPLLQVKVFEEVFRSIVFQSLRLADRVTIQHIEASKDEILKHFSHQNNQLHNKFNEIHSSITELIKLHKQGFSVEDTEDANSHQKAQYHNTTNFHTTNDGVFNTGSGSITINQDAPKKSN